MKNNRMKSFDRVLGLASIVLIVIAWVIGASNARVDLTSSYKKLFPEAIQFSEADGIVTAFKDSSKTKVLGYISTGLADGYGGKMEVSVALSSDAKFLNFEVFNHKETVSFFDRVVKGDFPKKLLEKNVADEFETGKDIDAVSGATYTSRAIAQASGIAIRKIAREKLNIKVIDEKSPEIEFGFKEIILLFLFAFAIVSNNSKLRDNKWLRRAVLLFGMITLGFIYNSLLSMAVINKFLMGYWPQWQTQLYWYLLLAGILIFIIFSGKNVYCSKVCPFGTAQRGVNLIGNAKYGKPQKYKNVFVWIQRILAFLIIIIALLHQNPSEFTYEVFGAFFQLLGTIPQFIVLGIALVAALLIKRPWCNYLCPVKPVIDIFRMLRNWIKELIFGANQKSR